MTLLGAGAIMRLQSGAQYAEPSSLVSPVVLQTAAEQADEALAARQIFALNADSWSAFMAALNAPPCPSPRLQKLLREPSVFELQA